MRKAEDIEHANREAFEDLVMPEFRDLKADLYGFHDDLNVGFDSLESRSDSQCKAILAAIETSDPTGFS